MQPRILLVASAAALAGAVLVWLSAPETGVPEAALPTPAATSGTTHSPSLTETRVTTTGLPAPAEALPAQPAIPPPPPRVVDPTLPDRHHVRPATPTGLIMAASARRPELLDCWEEYIERADFVPSGFSVDVTVRQEENGDQDIAVRVPEVHDRALQACLTDSFSDARFEALDQPAIRLVWRVPMPDE